MQEKLEKTYCVIRQLTKTTQLSSLKVLIESRYEDHCTPKMIENSNSNEL